MRTLYALDRRTPVPGWPDVEVGYSRALRRWTLARRGVVQPARPVYNWRAPDGSRQSLTVHRAMTLAGVSVVTDDQLVEERARPIPGWPGGPGGFPGYLLCGGFDGVQPFVRSWFPASRNLPGTVRAMTGHPWDGRPMVNLVGDDGGHYARQIGFFVLLADVGPPPDEDRTWVLHGEGGALDNQVTNLRWGDRFENWLDMKALRDPSGRWVRQETAEEAAWWADFDEDVA